MPETKNNFKKKESENEEVDFSVKKRRNNINRFLNSYFKYFLVVVIFAILLIAIIFLIKPQFKDAIIASNNILQERKTEFIKKYQELEKYKELIADFDIVDSSVAYKINKMVPAKYSRDDLFSEVTYFLISNNFKVDNVEVVSLEENKDSISLESDVNLGRRAVNTKIANSENTESTDDLYLGQLNSLPTNIGAWVVKVSVSDVDYNKLKKLLNVLENNLKLIDIYYLDFQPDNHSVGIEFLTYYKK